MNDIKHIVFDVGRVLLHWDPELPYLDLIPDADERNEFLASVCTPAWNIEQDRGRAWTEAENELIAIHPGKADLIRAYRARWLMSVPHAYDDVVDLFTRLASAGTDVTLLSNFNQDTFLEAEKTYSFLKLARGQTVSGRIGLLKPDPEIFGHHVEQFDLTPAHTVFIDDSEANVSSARQCGWHAIHFAGLEGAARLEGELEELGVRI